MQQDAAEALGSAALPTGTLPAPVVVSSVAPPPSLPAPASMHATIPPAGAGAPPMPYGRRPTAQQRNNAATRGVPWTEAEHRAFVRGLAEFGKGSWRAISQHHVPSRTSTQVASHAQKFFNRLRDRRESDVRKRPSILDITSEDAYLGVQFPAPKRRAHTYAPTNEPPAEPAALPPPVPLPAAPLHPGHGAQHTVNAHAPAHLHAHLVHAVPVVSAPAPLLGRAGAGPVTLLSAPLQARAPPPQVLPQLAGAPAVAGTPAVGAHPPAVPVASPAWTTVLEVSEDACAAARALVKLPAVPRSSGAGEGPRPVQLGSPPNASAVGAVPVPLVQEVPAAPAPPPAAPAQADSKGAGVSDAAVSFLASSGARGLLTELFVQPGDDDDGVDLFAGRFTPLRPLVG